MSIPAIPADSIRRFLESAQSFARKMYDKGFMTAGEARMHGVQPDINKDCDAGVKWEVADE